MDTTNIIYVSYHNLDYSFVLPFADNLIVNGISVYLDRFIINPIGDWANSVKHHIKNADLAIIIISQSYLECNYCQRELQYLINQQTPLYTIFIEDVPINKLHPSIPTHDWFDFQESENRNLYQANLEKFIRKVFPNAKQHPALSAEIQYLIKAIRTTEHFLFNTSFQQASLKIHHARNKQSVRPSGHAVKQFLHNGFYTLQMDDSSASMQATNELNIANLIEWLNVRTQLLLTGQSGCGKTFIARHLLLYSLHERLKSGSSKPLPLWINASAWHPDESLGSAIYTALAIDSNETSLMLFIDEIDKLTTWQIDEIMQWLLKTDGTLVATARSSEKLRLSLATLTIPSLPDAALQRVSQSYLPTQLAKKFGAHVQNNIAVGFDPSIYSRLEFVGWQMLLFQENGDNTTPQSPSEIVGQVVPYLWKHIDPKRLGRFTLKRLETALQLLAFKIINENEAETLTRQKLLASFGDDGLIQVTLDLGILDEVQGLFRFRSKTMQNYYAAMTIQQDGIYTRLSYPDFDSNGQYQLTRWDEVIQMALYSLPSTGYSAMIENIAEVDPFLATNFLQYLSTIPDYVQQDIIHKLLDAHRSKHYPDKAIRHAVSQLNNLVVTRDTLVEIQRSDDWGIRQLAFSLFFELNIDVPHTVIEQIERIDRTFPDSAFDILEDYNRLHLISLLIMLTTHPRVRIRRNAIWLMGQLKDKATIPALTIAIEDENQHIVQETISTLGLIGDMAVLPFVLRVANYPSSIVLTEVIALLHRFKRPILGYLLTLFRQTQTPISSEFTRLLAQVDETSLAAIIISMFPDDIRAQLGKHVTVLQIQSAEEGDTVKQLLEMISNHMQTLRNHEAFNDFVNSFTSRRDAPNPLTARELKDRIRGGKSNQPLQDDNKAPADIEPEATNIPQHLIKALHDDDWVIRQDAVVQLSTHDGNQALPLLLEASTDADCQVRIVALEALATLKDFPIAQEALVDALDDEDYLVIDTVTDILKARGDGILHSVLRKLSSTNINTLAAAIDVLGAIGSDSIVPQLAPFLDDMRAPWVSEKTLRDITAQALINMGTTTAIQAVHDADYTEKPVVETIILPEVEAMPQPQQRRSRFTPAEKITLALRALHGDDWHQSQKAARYIREYAKRLGHTTDLAVISPLINVLKDENWVVRWTATEALAWLKNPETEKHLVNQLADSSWIVRVAAIRALVELEAQNSAGIIARLLLDDHTAVREAVVEAIGLLKNRNVLPILKQAIEDSDDFVRLAAVQSMTALLEKEAVPLITHKLYDPYSHVRWATIQHLAAHPQRVSLEHFEAVLDDCDGPTWENKSISDYAVEALERIDSNASKALLDTWKLSN